MSLTKESRILAALLLSTLLLFSCELLPDSEKSVETVPGTGSLLVFYSWPNAINNASSAADPIAAAAAEYARYDYVVLNRTFTVSDCPTETVLQIINHPACSETLFFGYIDLGMAATSEQLSLETIGNRIDAWNDMGVDGIFFDEYGYDYEVTRARQNDAVTAVHDRLSVKRGRRLSVIANAWVLDDVFSPEINTVTNPGGLSPCLEEGDFYLLESFFISEGVRIDTSRPAELTVAKDRLMDAFDYTAQYGAEALTLTTHDNSADYSQEHFCYSWYAAAILGAEAAGWGEYLFSSSGVSLNSAPFRDRPDNDFGSRYTGDPVISGDRITRETDTGTLFVDTGTGQYGFEPR